MKWKPSKTPPDSARYVLVREPASSVGYAIAVYRRSAPIGERWVDSTGEYIDVSHWMPIPRLASRVLGDRND